MIRIKELFNLKNDLIGGFLNKYTYPPEILENLGKFILATGPKLGDEYHEMKENVWVHKSSKIGENVEILGPCIIMDNVTLKHNAYIRENVIIGSNSTIGNSSEIKNSILISNDQVPHFNYVGDSILGSSVHLGAGVILANLRFDKKNVKVEGEITNLRKIGAFIGDNTEIGCNSVVFPGTVIMPGSVIYPLSQVRNKYPEDKIRPQRI